MLAEGVDFNTINFGANMTLSVDALAKVFENRIIPSICHRGVKIPRMRGLPIECSPWCWYQNILKTPSAVLLTQTA
jgi:hypothetical protein